MLIQTSPDHWVAADKVQHIVVRQPRPGMPFYVNVYDEGAIMVSSYTHRTETEAREWAERIAKAVNSVK